MRVLERSASGASLPADVPPRHHPTHHDQEEAACLPYLTWWMRSLHTCGRPGLRRTSVGTANEQQQIRPLSIVPRPTAVRTYEDAAEKRFSNGSVTPRLRQFYRP